ncbi:hypothetical protein GCM10009560_56830 [Nonomuraea longicatena]|uniref:Peptidase C51 domain-containing protein n=2 Tax=Nonomuraea longicatena TaxID=83682 RepID=A0ABN1QJ70_9ACTN
MFIAWAADKAGVGEYVGQFAWTPSHAAWFIKQGAWSDKPEPGALVFYDWGGGKSYKGIDHVGIVEKVDGKKIRTIEANVDKVWLKRKFRDTEKVVGYGLPRVVKQKLAQQSQARPTEQPVISAPSLSPRTEVAADRGSPLDVLGTPQALLAAMVLATVVISIRLAGRRRGTHRRGLRALFGKDTSTVTIARPSPRADNPRAARRRASTDYGDTDIGLVSSAAGVSWSDGEPVPHRRAARRAAAHDDVSHPRGSRRHEPKAGLEERLDAFFGSPDPGSPLSRYGHPSEAERRARDAHARQEARRRAEAKAKARAERARQRVNAAMPAGSADQPEGPARSEIRHLVPTGPDPIPSAGREPYEGGAPDPFDRAS